MIYNLIKMFMEGKNSNNINNLKHYGSNDDVSISTKSN